MLSPLKSTTMPRQSLQKNAAIDQRIEKILDDMPDGLKVNWSQLARDQGVPYHRLLARSKGRGTLQSRPSGTYKLSDAQDHALYAYIERMYGFGVCVRLPMVVSCANYLLFRAHDPTSSSAPLSPPKVDARWAKRWIQRNPDLFIRRQQTLSLVRAVAHDEAVIRRWFNGLAKLIHHHRIEPRNTWNFDETGFRIGVGKSQWVITFNPWDKLYLPTPDDRTSVTIVECINAINAVLPPMIIIKAQIMMERFFEDLPDDYLLTTSDTGYVNDEICIEWARHFIKYSKPINASEKRLLLFDGFDSHCTKEFLEILEDHHVIPYRLPSHTSHFLQPLDVGCFQPYKHWHAEAVDAATRSGCINFNKTEFLAAIEAIRASTFKPATIQKGWKDSGLCPLNWRKISWKIAQLNPQPSGLDAASDGTPEREQTPDRTPEIHTPSTIRTLQRNIDYCLNKTTDGGVRRTLVGALRIGVRGDQAEAELTTMTSIAQSRRQRQTRDRRHVDSTMGVLSSQKARVAKQSRLQREISDLEAKRAGLKRMPMAQKARHEEAYAPIHAELARVWASMRSGGYIPHVRD
jgi:hypothetical protein